MSLYKIFFFSPYIFFTNVRGLHSGHVGHPCFDVFQTDFVEFIEG